MNYLNSRLLFIYILLLLLILLLKVLYVYHKSRIEDSPRLKSFLKKYGHYKIKSMDLCQEPLSDLVKNTFYYTSLGTIKNDFLELEKQEKILYHPYLILTIIEPDPNDFKKNKKYAKPIYVILEKLAKGVVLRLSHEKDINKLTTVGGKSTTQCIYNIIHVTVLLQ